jgi:uncharacterized protein YegL
VSVTPVNVNLTLPEGGSTTVNKTVGTPPIPPNPDIVFLVDTTGSMTDPISDVQSNIAMILSTVKTAQPTSQFAVVSYKDETDGAEVFTVLQNLTADSTAVQNAVNKLTPVSGGGDTEEAFINALFQVSTGAVSFRPGSTRIVLLIGDAASHDPSNGHTLTDAIGALTAAQIQVIAVDVGALDATGQAAAVTAATGGQLFKDIKADQVSATILAGLHNLPVTVVPVVVASDPNLAVSFNPGSQTVTSGTNATFVETISVSPAAPPGSTLTVQVDFLLNGLHQDGFIQTIKNEVPKHASVLNVSDATSDFHDPGTVSAVLADGVTNAPIAGAAVGFAMEAESCSGVTDATGTASCTIIPSEPAGVYPIHASFAGDAQHLGTTGTAKYTVTLEETTTEYTGPTVLVNGSTVVLTGVLKEDGVVPIQGRTLTLTLGSGAGAQSCSGTTDATGTAQCTVTVNQPLGPGTVTASFAGDPFYEPSSDTKPTLIFEFAAGGSFVIGDAKPGTATGTAVTFWGAQWDKQNTLTGGPAPPAFKGFEDSAAKPACGTSWTTSPGNSAPPPASVPSFLGVIVASSISKSGPAIKGDTVHVVVVKTNPGYEPNPGHAGTGTIAGIFC